MKADTRFSILIGLLLLIGSPLPGRTVQGSGGIDGFVHVVYFWLQDDVDASQKNAFIEGLKGLEKIRTVRRIHVGIPADTQRAVADNSYDIALVVYFRDCAGYTFYQDHPLHLDLIRKTKSLIKMMTVYDSVSR